MKKVGISHLNGAALSNIDRIRKSAVEKVMVDKKAAEVCRMFQELC